MCAEEGRCGWRRARLGIRPQRELSWGRGDAVGQAGAGRAGLDSRRNDSTCAASEKLVLTSHQRQAQTCTRRREKNMILASRVMYGGILSRSGIALKISIA